MDAFDRAAKKGFARRLAEQLAEEFPAVAARQGLRLQGTVDRGLAQAAAFGLKREAAVVGYVKLWFRCAFELDKRIPGASKVLKDKKVKDTERIGLLLEMMKGG